MHVCGICRIALFLDANVNFNSFLSLVQDDENTSSTTQPFLTKPGRGGSTPAETRAINPFPRGVYFIGAQNLIVSSLSSCLPAKFSVHFHLLLNRKDGVGQRVLGAVGYAGVP